jgi:hypothetical protein
VHSGTQEGKWYSDKLQFKDMNVLIAHHAADMRLWTENKTHVDLRKLAKAILFDADVKLSCSCPAAQYWGPNYILSKPKYDAKYGRQEDRRPKVRNPKEYGMLCKHLQVLINVLPFYITTMATWLKEQFASQIAYIEKDTIKTKGGFKAAAAELKRRKEEQPPEAPPEEPKSIEPTPVPPTEPEEEPEAEKEMPEIEKEPKAKIPLPTEPKEEEEPEEPIVPDEKRPELDRKAKLLKKKEKEAPKEKPEEEPEEITPRGRKTEPEPPDRPRVKKVEEPPTEEEGSEEITPRGRKSPELKKNRIVNKAKPPEEDKFKKKLHSGEYEDETFERKKMTKLGSCINDVSETRSIGRQEILDIYNDYKSEEGWSREIPNLIDVLMYYPKDAEKLRQESIQFLKQKGIKTLYRIGSDKRPGKIVSYTYDLEQYKKTCDEQEAYGYRKRKIYSLRITPDVEDRIILVENVTHLRYILKEAEVLLYKGKKPKSEYLDEMFERIQFLLK